MADPNIVDVATDSDDFDLLVTALATARLVDTVRELDDITVFAPTDAAFARLAAELGYTGNPAAEGAVFDHLTGALGAFGGGDAVSPLTEILLYHVVPSVRSAAEIASAAALPTLLDGADVAPGPDGTLGDRDPDLADPGIVTPDIAASNGRVHAIDGVLLPFDLPTNAPPTGAVVVSGTPTEGEPLTADASGIADKDGLGALSFAWLRDGTPIDGATGPAYTLTADDIGARISVAVFYTDGDGIDERVTSAATPPVADASDLIRGTPGPDGLIGTDSADMILGMQGDDTLTGAAGHDTIDGGAGVDVSAHGGPQSAYTVILSPDGTTVEDRRPDGEGIDTLSGIETLAFAEGDWRLELFSGAGALSEDAFRSFVEFYIAYFDRGPDAEGLMFWATAFADGFTLEQMAADWLTQPEYAVTYPPTLSNADFARAVYDNVLGRAPDEEGFDFWVGLLDDGTIGRDVFILEVLRGAKAPAPEDASEAFKDQKAEDVAYLSAKTDIGIHYAVTKGLSDVADARAAMELFDGSAASVTEARTAIDQFHLDALDPETGAFLLPLVGVLDDPLA